MAGTQPVPIVLCMRTTAHFEAEEEVLLPILDATMKPDEFRALMHAQAERRGPRR